jgi:uncharacterized RDD family membrane protein YckC
VNQRALKQRLIVFANSAYRELLTLRQPAPATGGGYATWVSRACAVIIDLVCYTMFSFIGFLFVAQPFLRGISNGKHQSLLDQIIALLVTIIFLVAPLVLASPLLLARRGKRNGQTVGKRIMRIRVVRDDGKKWTLRTAVWRQLVLKGALPFGSSAVVFAIALAASKLFLPLAVALDIIALIWLLVFAFWPFREAERRGLHDKLAHSHVVRVSSK